MRDGLPTLLTHYLRQSGEWKAKNSLTQMVWKYEDGSGRVYGADLVSRKLRNIEEDGVIAVKHVRGHSHYKYVPDYLRALYIPVSERTGEEMWRDPSEVSRLLEHYKVAS